MKSHFWMLEVKTEGKSKTQLFKKLGKPNQTRNGSSSASAASASGSTSSSMKPPPATPSDLDSKPSTPPQFSPSSINSTPTVSTRPFSQIPSLPTPHEINNNSNSVAMSSPFPNQDQYLPNAVNVNLHNSQLLHHPHHSLPQPQPSLVPHHPGSLPPSNANDVAILQNNLNTIQQQISTLQAQIPIKTEPNLQQAQTQQHFQQQPFQIQHHQQQQQRQLGFNFVGIQQQQFQQDFQANLLSQQQQHQQLPQQQQVQRQQQRVGSILDGSSNALIQAALQSAFQATQQQAQLTSQLASISQASNQIPASHHSSSNHTTNNMLPRSISTPDHHLRDLQMHVTQLQKQQQRGIEIPLETHELPLIPTELNAPFIDDKSLIKTSNNSNLRSKNKRFFDDTRETTLETNSVPVSVYRAENEFPTHIEQLVTYETRDQVKNDPFNNDPYETTPLSSAGSNGSPANATIPPSINSISVTAAALETARQMPISATLNVYQPSPVISHCRSNTQIPSFDTAGDDSSASSTDEHSNVDDRHPNSNVNQSGVSTASHSLVQQSSVFLVYRDMQSYHRDIARGFLGGQGDDGDDASEEPSSSRNSDASHDPGRVKRPRPNDAPPHHHNYQQQPPSSYSHQVNIDVSGLDPQPPHPDAQSMSSCEEKQVEPELFLFDNTGSDPGAVELQRVQSRHPGDNSDVRIQVKSNKSKRRSSASQEGVPDNDKDDEDEKQDNEPNEKKQPLGHLCTSGISLIDTMFLDQLRAFQQSAWTVLIQMFFGLIALWVIVSNTNPTSTWRLVDNDVINDPTNSTSFNNSDSHFHTFSLTSSSSARDFLLEYFGVSHDIRTSDFKELTYIPPPHLVERYSSALEIFDSVGSDSVSTSSHSIHLMSSSSSSSRSSSRIRRDIASDTFSQILSSLSPNQFTILDQVQASVSPLTVDKLMSMSLAVIQNMRDSSPIFNTWFVATTGYNDETYFLQNGINITFIEDRANDAAVAEKVLGDWLLFTNGLLNKYASMQPNRIYPSSKTTAHVCSGLATPVGRTYLYELMCYVNYNTTTSLPYFSMTSSNSQFNTRDFCHRGNPAYVSVSICRRLIGQLNYFNFTNEFFLAQTPNPLTHTPYNVSEAALDYVSPPINWTSENTPFPRSLPVTSAPPTSSAHLQNVHMHFNSFDKRTHSSSGSSNMDLMDEVTNTASSPSPFLAPLSSSSSNSSDFGSLTDEPVPGLLGSAYYQRGSGVLALRTTFTNTAVMGLSVIMGTSGLNGGSGSGVIPTSDPSSSEPATDPLSSTSPPPSTRGGSHLTPFMLLLLLLGAPGLMLFVQIVCMYIIKVISVLLMCLPKQWDCVRFRWRPAVVTGPKPTTENAAVSQN